MIVVVGSILFLGLIVLYIGRKIIGLKYKRLILVLVLIGILLFLIVDIILRNFLVFIEILVGIVVFIIGVLYFIYLMLVND